MTEDANIGPDATDDDLLGQIGETSEQSAALEHTRHARRARARARRSSLTRAEKSALLKARRAKARRIRKKRRQLRHDRGGRAFSERNPVIIGAMGMALIVAMMLVSFNLSKLPLVGGGTEYSASFAETGGIEPGSDVRVAGLKVGTVGAVSLSGTTVRIKFRVKGAFVGDQSVVSIQILTILGAKYLSVDSQGTKKQKAGSEIPISRTVSPVDFYPAIAQVTTAVGAIDTGQLSKSFEAVASSLKSAPGAVSQFLNGLSSLSQTIASRDSDLTSLVTQAKAVTGVVANRDTQLTALFGDGSALLNELNLRKQAIDSLIEGTASLAVNLRNIVTDNQATIAPALNQLQGVLTLLQSNQASLNQGLALLAPFIRTITNATGTGPWIDGYIYNLSADGFLSLNTGSPPDA